MRKMKLKLKDYYQEAVNIWGKDFLLDMLGEESVELLKAVFDFKRRKEGSFFKLLEEIVDVEIMIEQIKIALCEGADKNDYRRIRKFKLKRFKQRLEGGKA